MPDVLRARPGINVWPSIGGASISMHGLDARHLLVLVDGQRVTGRVSGVLDADRFMLEPIEQVEITKGPTSLLYGSDAVGGTINLVTRWPEKFTLDLRGGYGGNHRANARAYTGYGNVQWSTFAHGRFDHHAGWDLTPEDEATTADARTSFGGGAGFAFRGSERVSFDTQWNYAREDHTGIDLAAGGAVFERANRTEYVHGKVQPTIHWPNGTSAIALGWDHMRDQWLQDQRGNTALDQVEETLDHIATVDLRHEQFLTRHHILRFGYSLQLEWMQTPRIELELAKRQRHGIYVQHEWLPTLEPRIQCVTGVRSDWDLDFGFQLTSRVALLVRPMEQLSLRIQLGAAGLTSRATRRKPLIPATGPRIRRFSASSA